LLARQVLYYWNHTSSLFFFLKHKMVLNKGVGYLASKEMAAVIVSWGCCDKISKLDGLKQQKFILPQFWRLNSKIKVPLKAVRRLCGLPGVCWRSLVFLGLCTHHSDLCLCCHMGVSISVSLLIRMPIMLN
jgi:hypothetical protein